MVSEVLSAEGFKKGFSNFILGVPLVTKFPFTHSKKTQTNINNLVSLNVMISGFDFKNVFGFKIKVLQNIEKLWMEYWII